MKFSPIVIFTYNRIEHLNKLILSLKKNKYFFDSNVYIFSDGPKNKHDKLYVDDVRYYIRNKVNLSNILLVERDLNLGLSKNITTGLKQVFSTHDQAIILEDDLEVSPYFLKYMNDALEKFKANNEVASISGYMYPINHNYFSNSYFFLKLVESWGWATWRRAWRFYNDDAQKLKQEIDKKKLIKEFNFDKGISYYKMLKDCINKKNDSWAIRWYASTFLNDMITLFPNRSFVKNTGIDRSGTHCNPTTVYDTDLREDYKGIEKILIKVNHKDTEILKSFFSKIKYKRSFQMIISKVKKFLKI